MALKKKTKIILLISIIFIALIAARLATIRPQQRGFKGKRAVEKITVKVTQAKRGDIDLALSYIGSLKAKDEINVYSKVSGKLTEYLAGEGDRIEKGEVIALVDRDETGLKYELAKVESPLSGIVGRTLLDKGANISPGAGLSQGTVVAIIVNMDEMLVRLNISEPDIPYFKKGLKAEAKTDAYPDEGFTGEVTKVSELVDSQTRTLPIEITIPNEGRKLKSGMFARIKIIASQHKNILYLPQDAIVHELGADYVFAVEDNTARKKKITAGIKEDGKIEILNGVLENETVIIFGQQGLRDGTPIEIAKE